MRDANQVARDYIALWNETDATRRQALLTSTWTSDASYIDPLMSGEGHAGISALIDGVHKRFPDFRFSLTKPADGFGNRVRFSWGLGPEGSEPIIKGTDFVLRKEDRIASVTGFLDQVPAM